MSEDHTVESLVDFIIEYQDVLTTGTVTSLAQDFGVSSQSLLAEVTQAES